MLNQSEQSLVEEAWEWLKTSYIFYNGKPMDTVAAMDYTFEISKTLNINHDFVRDFIPTGLACLMKKLAELKIVKHFISTTLKIIQGSMPECFEVICDSECPNDTLQSNFWGSEIGDVTLVDFRFCELYF
ncbi:hypothetical protein SLA2020_355360 [Shorea laevis]